MYGYCLCALADSRELLASQAATSSGELRRQGGLNVGGGLHILNKPQRKGPIGNRQELVQSTKKNAKSGLRTNFDFVWFLQYFFIKISIMGWI